MSPISSIFMVNSGHRSESGQDGAAGFQCSPLFNLEKPFYCRPYKKLKDIQEERILDVIDLELSANFSFIEPSRLRIERMLSPYGIDSHMFCVLFDGATFEYFPKRLKVRVYIFETCYSFDFTKPQWLGAPLSKNTEGALLGHAPK